MTNAEQQQPDEEMIDPSAEDTVKVFFPSMPESLFVEINDIAEQWSIDAIDVLASAFYAIGEPGCEQAVKEFNEWLQWHQTQRAQQKAAESNG